MEGKYTEVSDKLYEKEMNINKLAGDFKYKTDYLSDMES